VYSALTLAALLILLDSPLQLYSVSFQLSFLAVWGLACLSPLLLRPWQNWVKVREDLPAWVKKSILWLGEAWAVSLGATLATLPVIVANFHQAPTYGIAVNLVVTPLIGGAAVILVFLGLLLSFLPFPITAVLLFLGRLIIDVSVYLMEWAAALPGVVVRLPAPTPFQTFAYFLVLISLFGASRRLWRWSGVTLGLVILLSSLAWSGISSRTSSGLILTALDTPREMALLATFPQGVSMVINAGVWRYNNGAARANAALLAYLHARQFRHLDYLAALTVTPENAPTLLNLAQEFDLQEFWYGGDRPHIQSFWELRNLLGDTGKVVKNLSLTSLTRDLGGVQVATRQLPGSRPGRSTGPVLLQLAYQGRQVLIIPPAPAAWRRQCLAAGLPPSHVLILPAANLRPDFLAACLRQVEPHIVIATGSHPAEVATELSQYQPIAWHFTRQGR